MLSASDLVSSQASCKAYTPVSPNDYNYTYTEIDSTWANDAKPLGYAVDSYIFEGAEPCFVLSSTSGNGRHIEVNWELDQEGTLMVKNSIDSTVIKSSGSKKSQCNTVPGSANSITYTFYCKGSGCESGKKTFWYRFVVEEAGANGQYNEDWCSERPSQNHPSDLLVPPLPEIDEADGDDDEGKASVLSIAFGLIIISLFTSILSTL